MGIHKKVLDKKCAHCGKNLIRIHMKNPFIDDFGEGCNNEKCKDYFNIMSWLNSSARQAAREEG